MINIHIRHKAFGEKTVLKDLQFDLQAGELVCLLGPSGCGKTTLLNILAGLDSDYEGSVSQQRCAYMFQEPRLLPWRTLRQNLELVSADQQQIEQLLTSTGLQDAQHEYPPRVSLGMQRRIALARCLLMNPDLILMDEPMVSLDNAMAKKMRAQIQQLRKQKPELSILYVTHDIDEASELGDRILILGGHPTSLQEISTSKLDRQSLQASLDGAETSL